MDYEWIHAPNGNEVLLWINDLFAHEVAMLMKATSNAVSADALGEGIRRHYRAGYCYSFAHMLKTAFGRGDVCWAVPFSHMVWVDDDGTPYDVEGIYEGEAVLFIPESFFGETDYFVGFRHLHDVTTSPTADELISVVERFCKETKQTMPPDISDLFMI